MTKFIYLANEAVKKVAVVAYHDKGAIKVLQGLLQHIFRFEVEVVGRLIEDKQVDGL